jgi:bacillithiol system protein YtxJ
MQVHYLDLIAHREVSNAIAERLHVAHESPQTLLVYKGECVLDQSHSGIIVAELMEMAQPLQG